MSWQVLNLRKLTEGGFSTIFIGTRSDNGQPAIVKYLRDKTPDNRRYFSREAKILRRGLHPRMAEFLGGDPDGPNPYYIMPFYAGGKLTGWAGRLTHEKLRLVARQMAEAVAAAHAAEIALGDLKPDNILLTKTGDLRVADPLGNGAGCTIVFGVNSGGTPGFWAPEVAARLTPISKAGDVFSFGATLYQLATGRVPIDNQNLDPWAAGMLVPEDVRNAILMCCAKNPRSRPTMKNLLAILQVVGKDVPQPAQVQAADSAKPLAQLIGGIAVIGLLAALFGE